MLGSQVDKQHGRVVKVLDWYQETQVQGRIRVRPEGLLLNFGSVTLSPTCLMRWLLEGGSLLT